LGANDIDQVNDGANSKCMIFTCQEKKIFIYRYFNKNQLRKENAQNENIFVD